jgi:protein involved in ribonucleotide reduction
MRYLILQKEYQIMKKYSIILAIFMIGYALIAQEIQHDAISILQKNKKIFRGFIRSGDYDSNPDLDFLIEAQEVADLQHFYLNRFQFIKVQKKYTKKYRQGIKKIRALINRFSKNEKNRVRIIGFYKENKEKNRDDYSGILELTSIVIYRKNKVSKYVVFDKEDGGIVGGIKKPKPF